MIAGIFFRTSEKTIWKVSGPSGKFPDYMEIIHSLKSKKSRGPKIQKSKNKKKLFFWKIQKNPHKFGRFDTSRSPVALFVAEI